MPLLFALDLQLKPHCQVDSSSSIPSTPAPTPPALRRPTRQARESANKERPALGRKSSVLFSSTRLRLGLQVNEFEPGEHPKPSACFCKPPSREKPEQTSPREHSTLQASSCKFSILVFSWYSASSARVAGLRAQSSKRRAKVVAEGSKRADTRRSSPVAICDE